MIEILGTGPLCSVQDGGRRGQRSVGVSVAGAMDPLAYRLGNVLVGNAIGAASIEITVFPFKAVFRDAARIALTGAACGATLDGRAMPPWSVFDVAKGQTLALRAPSTGARAYMAVQGGIDVPVILGSRSTDLKVGFGGYQGRSLRRGDLLAVLRDERVAATATARAFGIMPPTNATNATNVDTGCVAAPADSITVRVVSGPEHDAFVAADLDRFWRTHWRISSASNRIGYRLEGAPVKLLAPLEMLSHGIVPGVIQLPPDGRPIVMMADAQTSGGYPKVGTVIQADLWCLAQARAGSYVRFERVCVEAAVDAMKAQNAYVASVAASMWRA